MMSDFAIAPSTILMMPPAVPLAYISDEGPLAISICFTAVISGLLITALLIPSIEVLSGGMMDDIINLTIEVILGGFIIGLGIAFISAAVPAYQALNLNVVDALRQG